jgi:hypothetical protein
VEGLYDDPIAISAKKFCACCVPVAAARPVAIPAAAPAIGPAANVTGIAAAVPAAPAAIVGATPSANVVPARLAILTIPFPHWSAVDWLVEQLPLIQQEGLRDIIEQAKEMEKNQIISTFKDAQVFKVMNDETRAEQYYNENFGGEK